MSGKRDSNPRPSPWQGDAPPIELFPQCAEGQTRTDIPGFSDQCRDHLGYFGLEVRLLYQNKIILCQGRDLNPHVLRHTVLSDACLPFQHLGKSKYFTIQSAFSSKINYETKHSIIFNKR